MTGRRARSVKQRLAANVARLRAARGLSQIELAALSSVTQPLVSSIERGRANPTVESLYRIARALGADVADLFAATPET
jgi:transcriptional regulator with XRE-family HTH domain